MLAVFARRTGHRIVRVKCRTPHVAHACEPTKTTEKKRKKKRKEAAGVLRRNEVKQVEKRKKGG